MNRIPYCRSSEDGTIRRVTHYEVVDDSVALIESHTIRLFWHGFGNNRYIRTLLTSYADPLELARRLVRGLEYRIMKGEVNPMVIYESALSWLESECNKPQKENN